MNILYCSDHYYPFTGGRQVSTRIILEGLAGKHKVKVIGFGELGSTIEVSGISITFIEWPKPTSLFKRVMIHYKRITGMYLRKKLLKEALECKPGLIMADGLFTTVSVEVAKRLNIKSIVFIRDYDGFCPDRGHYEDPLNCSRRCFKCTRRKIVKFTYPLVWWGKRRYLAALKKADLVISNSEYSSDIINKHGNIDSVVLYPPILLPKTDVEISPDKRDSILFVKPVKAKGAELVLWLVNRLQHRKFIILGSGDEWILNKFKLQRNVTWIGYQNEMGSIYIRCRLTLVPSLLPEAFGRVAMESMAHGVVCLASMRGGLPEAVGDAGIILDPLDKIKWRDNIEQLFMDEARWKSYVKKGIDRAIAFDSNNRIDSFTDIVRTKLQICL